ncbi:hypothetical protein WDU94_008570 [Cyamophila willieti]
MACLCLILLLVSSVCTLTTIKITEYYEETDDDGENDFDDDNYKTDDVKTNETLLKHMIDTHHDEQQARQSNVLIHNWPQKENENMLDEIKKIARKLGINDPMHDVLGARRIGQKSTGLNHAEQNPDTPYPLVICLRDPETRKNWTTAFYNSRLWEEKWYVNEHLSRYNQYLMLAAKKWAKKRGWKFVWSKDCKVLLRKSYFTKVVILTRVEQLKELEAHREYSLSGQKNYVNNKIEQDHKLNNLIVRGYYQMSERPARQIVEEIGHKLGFKQPMEDVDCVMKNAKGHVIIRFKCSGGKTKWLRTYHHLRLRKEKWYLNEHLSDYNQRLYKITKEWAAENNWKHVWGRKKMSTGGIKYVDLWIQTISYDATIPINLPLS